MEPTKTNIPPLKNLTIENITENTNLINSQCQDPRMKYVLERLVTHLHEFARETRLNTDEWMTGLNFLTEVGQITDDVRHVCRYLFFTSFTQALYPYLTPMTPGIHPPLRRPRPLPPCRRNRPPQTPQFNRRHRPGPLPHPRSRNHHKRLPNLPRPPGRTPPCPLHPQRYKREPRRRRQDRYLGNGLYGPL